MKTPSILNGKQNATMSDEQAHSYVTILSSGIDEKFDIPESNCNSFVEKVLYQHLKASGIKPSIGLFVWICIISNGVPGNIVMWVWTISNLAKNQGKKTFSLRDWAFASGLVSDEEYSRCWQDQKQDGYNLLDQPVTWENLQHFFRN